MGFSDAEILHAIASGNDREALLYLYNKHFSKVRKYICDNSGTKDEAFDIFQDSIMVFFNYVTSKKFDPKYEIGAFIFTVSKNQWINQVKKNSKEVALPEFFDCTDNSGDIMESLISKERENEVAQLLGQLGDKCEELLRFSIFYKLKNSEICEKMGFSTENAVKTRKYKCLQKLISLIEANPSLKKAIQEL
jgi:RNA polymerase sigma factor (sigma-70 family)